MGWSQGGIVVQVGALRAGASLISNAGLTAQLGETMVRSAGSDVGAFGGEPVGAAFSGACARGGDALGSITDALGQLATNTAAAAEGYVVTDNGAIPSAFGLNGAMRVARGQSP